MLQKVRLITVFLVALALLIGASPPVSATGPTNIDLQHAQPINNQQMTFPANSVLWFSFYYPGGSVGNRPPVTAMLLNGNAGHLAFKVWTPEQAADMTNQVAIGQGTPVNVNCRIRTCPSADLQWEGAFFTAGTYYLEVFNNNPNDVVGTLTVQGNGVASTAPSQPGTSQPSTQIASGPIAPLNVGVAAAASPTMGFTNFDLQHALPINNQQISFPANSVMWFRFQYPGGNPGNRPPVTVTLLNGNWGHLSFKVWTPEQAADMTNQVAIGQGTAVKLNCRISTCPSSDLTWGGAFFTPGTYYVEVFNNTPDAVSATLVVQGSVVAMVH